MSKGKEKTIFSYLKSLSPEKVQKIDDIAEFINYAIPNIDQQGKYSGLQTGISGGLDAGVDVASQFLPVVGPIWKGVKGIDKGLQHLGGYTDAMTTQDAIVGSIPLLGSINGFFGEKSTNFDIDKGIRQTLGSGYSGTYNSFDETKNLANKKYGILSQSALDKANEAIFKAMHKQDTLSKLDDIKFNQQEKMNSDFQYRADNYRKKVNGFDSTKFNFKFAEGGIVPEFAEGGKVNVIPSGALHTQKHKLDEENITPKGIPVVTEENGEIIQHAEIERDEIIFNIDVTKKLEELYKDGSEEAMIEAGKILVYEILNNTEDNTGLIDKVK